MEERAIAYWYVTQVVDEHLDCLQDIILVVSRGGPALHDNTPDHDNNSLFLESGAYSEMTFQLEFLAALNTMSMAMFAVHFLDQLAIDNFLIACQ